MPVRLYLIYCERRGEASRAILLLPVPKSIRSALRETCKSCESVRLSPGGPRSSDGILLRRGGRGSGRKAHASRADPADSAARAGSKARGSKTGYWWRSRRHCGPEPQCAAARAARPAERGAPRGVRTSTGDATEAAGAPPALRLTCASRVRLPEATSPCLIVASPCLASRRLALPDRRRTSSSARSWRVRAPPSSRRR